MTYLSLTNLSFSYLLIFLGSFGCSEGSGLLTLTPGTTYKYSYDGKINIELSSAEGQQTSTAVKATVLLTQKENYTQILRLQNVQIIGPDGKKRVGLPGIEKAVVLNSNNGILSDFLCVDKEDNQNSLNLKRAIASFFQVNSHTSSEIDVFGQCPTDISRSQIDNLITISKNKNLNKCSHRESISNNVITSTINLDSGVQSVPILNSNFDSKQTIKDGVLNFASFVENYLFVPFSVGQNGAKASVYSILSLIGTSNENTTAECEIHKSIIFENPHPVNTPKSNAAIILKKVKDISDNLVDNLTPLHFVDLVKLLRVSKKLDILMAYNQVKSGAGIPDRDGAKKTLLDAILIAGNGDSIEAAIELLKTKELSQGEQKQLYIGLSFARHVTENSIKSATDLLSRANIPRESYLGVGSLAGKFCAQHKCNGNVVINELILKLMRKLVDLRATDIKEENDMIFALKGLSNINYLSSVAISKIVSIAESKDETSRLRNAALETYETQPCDDIIRNSALKILRNFEEDSEIRINAYRVLTRCPNSEIGNAVKILLEKEKSQQVGAYISSHIKHIRSSTNPDKILAKTYLGFIHTPTRFPFDPRKYSFNSEFSSAMNAFGLSNSIEGNIIYSQKSWMPRAVTLNLTAEIFGKRLNFLELAARQQNLDILIEHYFGPQGILVKSTLQQNWDNIVNPVKDLIRILQDKMTESLRTQRDVTQQDIDALASKIQDLSNELDKNLNIDLTMRMFGSEVLFLNSFDATSKRTPQQILENLISCLDGGLDKLKSFEKTFRKNMFFLDAELSYPTSLGFPLRLGLDGATNVQVKTEGNFDIRKLISKTAADDINLKFSIIPSATITISGRFSLDTPLLENGLKVSSTIHTFTGVEFMTNTFKRGLGLDVKLNWPVQKQNLIDLKHDIIFQTKENGVVLKNQHLKFSQNKELSICADQLANYIGLELCVDMNGPNLSGKRVPILPFPLSGNAEGSIRIERNDIDTLHYRREFAASKERRVGVMATLESLGKNNTKGVSLNVEGFLTSEKYVKISLNSPMKNAQGEARLILNDTEKMILLSFINENSVYTAKAGLKLDGSGDRIIYKPILEYSTPDKTTPQIPPFHLEGQINYEKNRDDNKYVFDNIKLVFPEGEIVFLTGDIGNEGYKNFADLTLNTSSTSGSIKGSLQLEPNILKFQAHMKNSVQPNFNFDVNGEFQKHKGSVSSNLEISHGQEYGVKKDTLILINSFNIEGSKEMKLSTKNKLSYPPAKLNVKFDLEKTAKSLYYDTYLHFGEVKIGSELKLDVHSETVGDYKLDLQLFEGKNKLEFKSTRQVIGVDQSKIENSLALNGKKIDVSGKIQHRVEPYELNVGADLSVKFPNSRSPIKLINGLKFNYKEIDFHLRVLFGTIPWIDAMFKANKNNNANGHIKINHKDLLRINGNIKAQNGVGKSEILIEAKLARKSLKAETSFNIMKPTYNLDLTIYPDYSNGETNKIFLSTKTKWDGSHLDTINTIDFLGNVFSVNGKGQLGNLLNGKNLVDVELVLPNQNFLKGILLQDVYSKDGTWNSKHLIHLEQRDKKDTAGRKLFLKCSAEEVNLAKGTVHITASLVADDSAAHNINLGATLKRTTIDEQASLQFAGELFGSNLKTPIIMNFNVKEMPSSKNFDFKFTTSPEANIQVEGEYNVGDEDNPLGANVNINLQTPLEVLSRLQVSQSFIKTNTKDQKLAIESSGSLRTVSSIPKFHIDSKNYWKISLSANEGILQVHGESSKPINSALDLSGHYNSDVLRNINSVGGDFKVTLHENTLIQGSGTFTKPMPHEYRIEAFLDLPTKIFKSNNMSLVVKRMHNQMNQQLDLISDGRKYTLTSDLSISIREPKVDIKFINSVGKISEFAINIKRPSKNRILANLKVMNQCQDFILEGDLNVNSESLNDFFIRLTANCPKFNINDIFVEIERPEMKNENIVNVLLKSQGRDIVSGSAAMSSQDEGDKFVIEGSGNFKFNNEEQSGNFKYTKNSLRSDETGEIGEEISFDGKLGNRAVSVLFKCSNEQFRYLNSYCEESNKCAHFEINAKTSLDEMAQYDNFIEIIIDPRIFGVSSHFGLKVDTHIENWMLDHTLNLYFENSVGRYQGNSYIHPNASGMSLTTPQRIIALEVNTNFPTSDIQSGGRTFAVVDFYSDKKNNPNTKTSLGGNIILDTQSGEITADLTLKLVGQNKPLSIMYKQTISQQGLRLLTNQELVIDIFAQSDQQIVISRENEEQLNENSYEFHKKVNTAIKSSGFGLEVLSSKYFATDLKALSTNFESSACFKFDGKQFDTKIKLSGTPKEVFMLIQLPDTIVLDTKFDISFGKNLLEIKGHSNLLGLVVERKLEIENYKSIKYEVYLGDDPSTKFLANAAFIPGQIADARSVFYKGSDKKELFHATIKLDDRHFLKEDVAFHSGNFRALLEKVRSVLIGRMQFLASKVKLLEKLASENIEKILGKFKESVPDVNETQQYYQSELNKLKDELATDKSFENIAVLLKNVLSTSTSLLADIINTSSDLLEKMIGIVSGALTAIIKSTQIDIIPKTKEILAIPGSFIQALGNNSIDILYIALTKAVQTQEMLQPYLKSIVFIPSEITEDIAHFIFNIYEKIRTDTIEQLEYFKEELKASALGSNLKFQFNEFVKNKLPPREVIANAIGAVSGAVKEVVSNPEIQNMTDLIKQYLENKVLGKPVDDGAELKRISNLSLRVLGRIASVSTKDIVPDLLRSIKVPRLTSDLLKMFLVDYSGVKVSALEYLFKEDHTPFLEFLRKLVVTPRDMLIPPPYSGEYLGSEFIVTFDRRHYNGAGNCTYLLAKDIVDGNFSLSYTIKDEQVDSFVMGGKFGTITLQKNKILFNNVETEYPLNIGGIHAYRHVDRIEIVTDLGLWVSCHQELIGCGFKISGFYHGRMRGVLGNANNEEFDELLLSNGTIASSVEDMAADYSTGQCNRQLVDLTDTKPSPFCEETFGWGSPLRHCFPFIPRKYLKKSCEMSAALNREGIQLYPLYYTYKCWEFGLPVTYPDTVKVSCRNSINIRKIGDKFDVQLPGKMADVVILLKANKDNEIIYKEYLQPLAKELIKQFKTKGIPDVLFHIIIYGGENPEPSIVTVKGKITFTDQAPNIKFIDVPSSLKLVTGYNRY